MQLRFCGAAPPAHSTTFFFFQWCIGFESLGKEEEVEICLSCMRVKSEIRLIGVGPLLKLLDGMLFEKLLPTRF